MMSTHEVLRADSAGPSRHSRRVRPFDWTEIEAEARKASSFQRTLLLRQLPGAARLVGKPITESDLVLVLMELASHLSKSEGNGPHGTDPLGADRNS